MSEQHKETGELGEEAKGSPSKLRGRKILRILAWAAGILAVLILVLAALGLAGRARLAGKRPGMSAPMGPGNAATTSAPAASVQGTGGANAEEDPASNETTQELKEGQIRYKDGVYEYNDRLLTFLVMGIDDLGEVTEPKDHISGGQADALFLVVLDPNKGEITVLTLNRNTMVDMDAYNKEGEFIARTPIQLCIAHAFGGSVEANCENQVRYVSELLQGIPIHGYVSINMGGVATLNDAVGGVPVREISQENGELTYGEYVTLWGEGALYYLEFRDIEAFDSVSFRQQKHKEYLKSFVDKVIRQLRYDPMSALSLYHAIRPYLVTDIDLPEIIYLAGQIAHYSLSDRIYSLEGETTIGRGGFEEFYPDPEKLEARRMEIFYRRVGEEAPAPSEAEIRRMPHAGDIVSMGRYDQYDAEGEEPILWRVLEETEEEYLLISLHCLTGQDYAEKTNDLAWEASGARAYLNGAFYENAFSEEEKACILPQPVGEGGPSDPVFLPDASEAERLFYSDQDRKALATAVAEREGVLTGEGGYAWWRLRTPSETAGYTMRVSETGHIDRRGSAADNPTTGLRPALWVRKDTFAEGGVVTLMDVHLGDTVKLPGRPGTTEDGAEDAAKAALAEWTVVAVEEGDYERRFLVILKDDPGSESDVWGTAPSEEDTWFIPSDMELRRYLPAETWESYVGHPALWIREDDL